MMRSGLYTALAMTMTAASFAGTPPYFNPLTQSAAVGSPNHVNEINSPWQAPAGISQVNLTSMSEIEADMDQSVVRATGAARSASMWDMVAFDPTGKYVFIPHETPWGAGVSRYSIENDTTEVLFSGDESGQRGVDGTWGSDYGAFDPATFTPYGTVLLGEEWSGEGRVIEVLNPMAPVEDIEVVEKQSFANVSQEGIRFGKKEAPYWSKGDEVFSTTDTVYYVDEDRSGSIYKLVTDDTSNFDSGETYVLKVTGFDGDSSMRYNDAPNLGTTRTGEAEWVLLTEADTNPFENSASTRPGRIAADEVGATPYGRPEDVEVGELANGNEVLYFTATSEATVYSVEMIDKTTAFVRVFASEGSDELAIDATPKNLGFPSTTGVLNSPDNLAQDAFGNIYIIEDAPNGSDVGGDIWFVRDIDNDGIAESIDHFLSLQVDGSEHTGMIFNPAEPTQFVVSVQHPDSTDLDNVPNGQGDALWVFDLTKTEAPSCQHNVIEQWSRAKGISVNTCSNTWDYNFVQKLNYIGK